MSDINDFEIEDGVLVAYDGEDSEVVIPVGVTRIDAEAFCENPNIVKVTIPEGVTSIGEYAFSDCYNLTTVDLPKSLRSIENGAFHSCPQLESITIPANVTKLGDAVFNVCTALTSITVEEGNTVYHSSGNCLIETATKKLYLGCKNSKIPQGVRMINKYAFGYCEDLKKILLELL